jgi:hypothetical protein
LARDVVAHNPDLIITTGDDLVLDFKATTTTIPIAGNFVARSKNGAISWDRKAKILILWRSRQKWAVKATTTTSLNKHPYPRPLSLKAFLPRLQTLAIAPAPEALVLFARSGGERHREHKAEPVEGMEVET